MSSSHRTGATSALPIADAAWPGVKRLVIAPALVALLVVCLALLQTAPVGPSEPTPPEPVGAEGAVQKGLTTVITCRGHVATLVGTAGNDFLVGTAGPDVIAGPDPVDPPVPDNLWAFTTQADSEANSGTTFTAAYSEDAQGLITSHTVTAPGGVNYTNRFTYNCN